MKRTDITWSKVPQCPGVYFFLGIRKEILYIGKATSLRSRTKSYFDSNVREIRSPLIERMVEEAQSFTWTTTDSVLEAMLLETNLIRTHKPRYNTIAKDDKSYNHLAITNEEFPRVLVIRGKDLIGYEDEYQKIFGPFPNASLFKEALKLIKKLFQFYDGGVTSATQTSKLGKGKLDFNRQIGLYPNHITKREYMATIRHIILLFEGKKDKIIHALEREMATQAKYEKFEKANEFKKKIFALKHIQDVSLIKDASREYRDDKRLRIEAYDIAHLQGTNMVGAMTVVEGGQPTPTEYRKFKINSCRDAHDIRALTEVLTRRLRHDEWPLPACIVVDGSTPQIHATEKVLKTFELHIPVVSVVKDEHHKPKDILGPSTLIKKYQNDIILANAESHRFAIAYHRQKRSKLQP